MFIKLSCSLIIGSIILSIATTQAYTFGMLSHDDSIESIQAIEEKHQIKLNMVSIIRDEYNQQAQEVLQRLPSTLGTGRVYHLTLSPRAYTAEQVYGGYFDREYSLLFKNIKNSGIKVIFRTMHEMNGWRYPRSGNPEQFKKARAHIYTLSREAGLDQSQILFDFSTNAWDMPAVGWVDPWNTSNLIKCTPAIKKKIQCITWEDYYPGDEFVDLMGVTFYNRGKATSNRARYSPKYIMEEPEFNIWNRLKSKAKPIIIDEVGTTSVRYTENYNRHTSLKHYQSNSGAALKNWRLSQLTTRAKSKPELVGLNYFNVDRTMGLAWENPGEADRSAIDLDYGKYYPNIMKLYQWGDNNLIELFITPEQKRKEHIGTWKKGAVKKKPITYAPQIGSGNSGQNIKINQPNND